MNQSSIRSLRWVFQEVISKKCWAKWWERKPQSTSSQGSNFLQRKEIGALLWETWPTLPQPRVKMNITKMRMVHTLLGTDWHVSVDLQILVWPSGDISRAVMVCWVFDAQTVSSLVSGLLFWLTTGHFHVSLLSKYFLILWNKVFLKDGRYIISIVVTSTEVELNAG